MIVVYLNWKRIKEYKDLELKNIEDQNKVCLDLWLNEFLSLSKLEKDKNILLKQY